MATYIVLQLEAPRILHPPFQILPTGRSMTMVSVFASAPSICASPVMLHSHGEWKHWMLPVSKFSISPVLGQPPVTTIELTMQFGCISSSIGSFSITSEAGPFDSEILSPDGNCMGYIRGLRSIKEIDEGEKEKEEDTRGIDIVRAIESTNSEKEDEKRDSELEELLIKKLLEVVECSRPMVDAMPASTQQPSEAAQLSAVETIQPPASAPGQVKNEKALVCCSTGTTSHVPKDLPSQSSQHSCHSEEEERRVQLETSGFQFAPRTSHFDWRRILAVYDQQISKNGDITTLESILPDIAFGEVDWSHMDVDPTLRKAYEAAKLSCQYLLHYQEVLKIQCGAAEKATRRLELQALARERQGRDMRNVIRRLKHERRNQNRLIGTYSGMLRHHNPELAARVYIEEETGNLQLLSQSEVDEGILTSAGNFQAVELMNPPAVKSLFGLQNHNQLYTTESKEIDSDEPIAQLHERGYTESSDVDSKGPKVRIDTKRTPSSLKDKEFTLEDCCKLEDNSMGGLNGGEVGFPGGGTTCGVMKQLKIESISIEEGLTS